jgi:hypothetical protein
MCARVALLLMDVCCLAKLLPSKRFLHLQEEAEVTRVCIWGIWWFFKFSTATMPEGV